MIQHVWSVLCQSGAIDVESGTVSLFNVVEGITVFGDPNKPSRIPFRFELISLWVRENQEVPTKGQMRVFFCDPNDECKKQLELPVDLSEHLSNRTRIRSEGIELQGPGKYKFIVELKVEEEESWKPVATIPFFIVYEKLADEKNPE